MTAPLRLGLAGLGVHGMRYARHLLAGDVPGAVLAAVSRADRTAGGEFAAPHGLRFFPDPIEMAGAPDLDGVLVVLRPDLNVDLARACLEGGRPLLVEKPLACNGPDARSIAELAGRAGTPLLVSQTLRFDPLVRMLRDLAPTVGPLRVVAINQRFEPSDRSWIDTPGPGGCVLNTGVHGFDLLRFLTGAEPVSIQAEVSRVETRQTEDQFAAVVRLEPGGILATVDSARTTTGRSGRIEIVGERGQIRGDHIHRWLHRIEGRTETDLGPIPAEPTVALALRAFVEMVRNGTPSPVTAADGAAAVEMVDVALLAARLGRRVALP